jgi:hypothetical protein
MEKSLFIAAPEDERLARALRSPRIFEVRLYIVGKSIPLHPLSLDIGTNVFVLLSNAFLRSRACRSYLDDMLELFKIFHVVLAEEIREGVVPALAENIKEAYLLYGEDGRAASHRDYRMSEYKRLLATMDSVSGISRRKRTRAVQPKADPPFSPVDLPDPAKPPKPFIVERKRRRVPKQGSA